MNIKLIIKTACIGCLLITQLISASYAEDNQQHQIQELQQQLEKLQLQIDTLSINSESNSHADNQLTFSGFFDITLHDTRNNDKPFELGGLELDLQYDAAEIFSLSSALVWTDDGAEVAVALLDYHNYDHNVPTRGRLFEEPGYHIQLGRFDLPFGADYAYYAAPDRPNVTAPMTTERILDGGLNSDGFRVYGSHGMLDYALYWTNSSFADDGSNVGTRVGIFPGRNPYRIHRKDQENAFSIGLSILRDMGQDEQVRNRLGALDIYLRLGPTETVIEAIKLNSKNVIELPDNSIAGNADERSYNFSILYDLEPSTVYVRYEKWKPDYNAIPDENGVSAVAMDELKRITLGYRNTLAKELLFKLEYYSHMDTRTEESDFVKRRATLQIVAMF